MTDTTPDDTSSSGQAGAGVFQTGFDDLDALTGGLRAGEVTLLAGRCAIWVQRLALNILAQLAVERRVPTLLVDGAGGDSRAYETLVACALGATMAGALEPPEDDVEGMDIFYGEKPVRDAPWARCTEPRAWQRDWNSEPHDDELTPRVIVMGPLGSIATSGVPGCDPASTGPRRIAALCDAVAALARRAGMAVLSYVFINDGFAFVDEHPPFMEADAHSMTADTVLVLQRVGLARIDEDRRKQHTQANIHVVRAPHGRVGVARLRYERSHALFWSIGEPPRPWLSVIGAPEAEGPS